jgi:hypothetical protein
MDVTLDSLTVVRCVKKYNPIPTLKTRRSVGIGSTAILLKEQYCFAQRLRSVRGQHMDRTRCWRNRADESHMSNTRDQCHLLP